MASYHDNMSPMTPKNNNGVGDYARSPGDRYQHYWDTMTQGRVMPPQRPVVLPPDKQPVPPDEADRIRAIAQVAKEVLTCGLYYVKNPNWVQPPITATTIDLRTERSVAVGVPDTVIITRTIPDRFVGTLVGFGHALDNPAGFGGGVTWNIRVNGGNQFDYTEFEQQIGTFVNPTLFPTPIRVKYRDVIEVTARQGGFGAVGAFARLLGWMWPVKDITNDGTFGENHTI